MRSADWLAKRWIDLPRRVYLDTSILQTIYDYDGVVFEGEPYDPLDTGAQNYLGHEDQVLALQMIFTVNERAQFEFVVSEANLREVVAHGYAFPGYKQWVLDVLDVWSIQLSEERPKPAPPAFERSRNISQKDRLLLQDALSYDCDAFLTMEKKLPTQASFIQEATGLRVLNPTEYWDLMAPWARLYY